MSKTIYIDADCKCHVTDDGTMTAVETDFFDGKCTQYIEGYRCVPDGAEWVREDGKVFRGPMIAPHMDYAILAAYQQQYEAMQAGLEAAYQEGVDSV